MLLRFIIFKFNSVSTRACTKRPCHYNIKIVAHRPRGVPYIIRTTCYRRDDVLRVISLVLQRSSMLLLQLLLFYLLSIVSKTPRVYDARAMTITIVVVAAVVFRV